MHVIFFLFLVVPAATDIVFIFDIASKNTEDPLKVLGNIKKLATGMAKKKMYETDKIKIATAYANAISNFNGNKKNVVTQINGISLKDTEEILQYTLPAAISKLSNGVDATRKTILLFTNADNYRDFKDQLLSIKDKGIKFVVVFFRTDEKGSLKPAVDPIPDPIIDAIKPIIILNPNIVEPEISILPPIIGNVMINQLPIIY